MSDVSLSGVGMLLVTFSLEMNYVDGSGNSDGDGDGGVDGDGDGDGDWFGWLERKILALSSVFRGGINRAVVKLDD